MHQQWKVFLASAFARAILLGACASYRHRVDGFQMARIGYQMNVNLAATPGDVFAGGAHVVLHVSGAEDTARVDIFKSREDFLRRALGDVRNHVEPAAVAHAHHQFDRAQA